MKRKRNRIGKLASRTRKKWFRGCGKIRIVPVARSCEGLGFSSASIYRSEFEAILKEIAASPDCETGGELFGFYRDDGTPVVCYAIGPGPNANHQFAFFNQDLDYLETTGETLVGGFGLEHIGEWHSHHRLGLARPSGHDAATVANGVKIRGRRRFLLCVGNIVENRASLAGFAFTGDSGLDYRQVTWQIVDKPSPYREAVGDL